MVIRGSDIRSLKPWPSHIYKPTKPQTVSPTPLLVQGVWERCPLKRGLGIRAWGFDFRQRRRIEGGAWAMSMFNLVKRVFLAQRATRRVFGTFSCLHPSSGTESCSLDVLKLAVNAGSVSVHSVYDNEEHCSVRLLPFFMSQCMEPSSQNLLNRSRETACYEFKSVHPKHQDPQPQTPTPEPQALDPQSAKPRSPNV